MWSARTRARQARQSTSGSAKLSTWPEACQTFGLVIIAASMPTMSVRSWTMLRHHESRMLRFISTPSGP